MNKDKFSFYKEHPKTCNPDDFWGQVKRTVNGTPVSQDQIDLIVNVVVKELGLNQQDTLLDLCCGNGALTTLLFSHCKGGLGVDFSEFLIGVANKNFSKPPNQTFLLQDVVEYCEKPIAPSSFTKMVCYGSFPFIEYARAELLLRSLNNNFPNLTKLFIGNCPDKELLSDFYRERDFVAGVEKDPSSAIGIWRTESEFLALASRCGWQAQIHKMPNEYYAAHYRYDVVLSK